VTYFAFTQNKINYFRGDFDKAIEHAKTIDKDIFLITVSESCQVSYVFRENIIQDSETVKFLNDEFIVFEFDIDKANEKEIKRMKKYYHSWRGFPQLYFIDKNEKLISDIVYTLNYEHEENLEVWKNYTSIEDDWNLIKRNKRNNLSLENLKKFLFYRQIKYSPYDLMQSQNVIKKYFDQIEEQNISNKENWILFEQFITHASNPKLFDFVVKHKKDFQEKNGNKTISDYLIYNYTEMLSWKTKEDRTMAQNEYPFNTIPEAKTAFDNFEKMTSIFEFAEEE
jgi:hypothetical protein